MRLPSMPGSFLSNATPQRVIDRLVLQRERIQLGVWAPYTFVRLS
jgi:hypothetical protein